jgi:VWFA-related protein
VFNIIMLDTITISPMDQMYLRQELDHFIQALPPDEPFAIFARNNEHTVMLANFTADHQKLLSAVHYELPRLLPSGFRYYSTDISLMAELCAYLEQYPGRKNVLWFNGGSALALQPDPTTLPEYVDLRPLYDELEKARVALYPIDARGLVVSPSGSMPLQQLLMEDEADATGGQAFFNTNGLAKAARQITDTDASFYTLTYSPQEVKLDNKWHKVKVEVEGGSYQLSYRRGYYDDGSNLKQPDNQEGRRQLLENGATTAPDLHTKPIIFQVSIAPADLAAVKSQPNMLYASTSPLRKGERAYVLHYTVPLDAFPLQTADVRDEVSVGLALLAYNQYGRPVARVTQKLTLGFPQERVIASGPSPNLGFQQEVNLPKGRDFLYVAVWNTQTGRLGTVQIPLTVGKAQPD